MNPSRWTWKCHVCHTQYPLGATRRCLVDGHYLCTGEIKESRRTGKLKRKNACSSDFDYKGWYLYAMRRETLNQKKRVESKGCSSNCFHPSECRWHPERHNERIRNESFNGQVTLSYNSDGSTSVRFGPTGPSQEVDGKVREYLTTRHSRLTSKVSELHQSEVQHPNPLSSTPTAPAIAAEQGSREPSAVAELISPATEGHSLPPSQPTTIAPKNTKRSSKTICKSFAERTAKRKARQKEKTIIPLSPIKEESQSPKTPPSIDQKVSRPALSFSNHLDAFLKSKETGCDTFSGSDVPRKDIVDEADTAGDTDPLHPFPGRDIDSKVSRPVLNFTRHFVHFLESQKSGCDSFIAPAALYSVEADEVDLDDPDTSSQSMKDLNTCLCGVNNEVHNDRLCRLPDPNQIKSSASGNRDFDFSVEQDQESPISPRRTAWDWTAGSIGIALSEPLQLDGDNVQGDEVEVAYSAW